MIEFNGTLSGASEKRFCKKSAALVQNILFAVFLLYFPGVLVWGIKLHNWELIILYCSTFALFFIMTLIPKSKKEIHKYMPKRIVIDGEYITCYADKGAETKSVQDVKSVIDRGEFYEFNFPFGKISEKFICQKSLLSKGTLEEFEMLFENKLVTKLN